MKKQVVRVVMLLVLIAGLGFTMWYRDDAQRPHPPKIPQNIEDTRAKDLKSIVNKKAKNWLVDPKLKVVTTKSGLKYQDVREGKGQTPKQGDLVVVDYVGWQHPMGRVFDTSLSKGREPITFHVGAGEVIKGWDEGVASMKLGGIRRLIIPPDLAYGEIGAVPTIPPNATLSFMVKLLSIQPGKK